MQCGSSPSRGGRSGSASDARASSSSYDSAPSICTPSAAMICPTFTWGRSSARMSVNSGPQISTTWLAIVDDISQFARSQPPVQRRKNRPDLRQPVEQVNVDRAVMGQDRDPITLLHAQALPQEVRQPVRPRVQLAVVEPLPRVEVHQRLSVGRQVGTGGQQDRRCAWLTPGGWYAVIGDRITDYGSRTTDLRITDHRLGSPAAAQSPAAPPLPAARGGNRGGRP